MMRYLLLCIVVFIISCNNNGTSSNSFTDAGLLQSGLAPLLPDGQYIATVTFNKDLNAAQKKLLKKLRHIFETHENFQDELNELLENPGSIKPGNMFGLSEEELKIAAAISQRTETAIEKDSLFITNNGNTISFKGSGRLSVLDSLVINVKDTSAMYKDGQLEYYKADSSYLSNDYMPPGEELETIFPFDGPTGILGMMPGTRYVLVIGRFNKTKRTYLYFDLQEMDMERPGGRFYSIILN